jgi:hypothetical protein
MIIPASYTEQWVSIIVPSFNLFIGLPSNKLTDA